MDSPTAALKADRSGGRRLRVRRRRRLQALPAQAGVVLGMVALLLAWSLYQWALRRFERARHAHKIRALESQLGARVTVRIEEEAEGAPAQG